MSNEESLEELWKTARATWQEGGEARSRWAFVLFRGNSVITRQSGEAARWVSTPDFAELWAVAQGIWWMLSHGIGTVGAVNILVDAKSIVRLLRSPLDREPDPRLILARAVVQLSQAFNPARFIWVPRGQNREADDLASLRVGRETKNARKNQRRRVRTKEKWRDRAVPVVVHARKWPGPGGGQT